MRAAQRRAEALPFAHLPNGGELNGSGRYRLAGAAFRHQTLSASDRGQEEPCAALAPARSPASPQWTMDTSTTSIDVLMYSTAQKEKNLPPPTLLPLPLLVLGTSRALFPSFMFPSNIDVFQLARDSRSSREGTSLGAA